MLNEGNWRDKVFIFEGRIRLDIRRKFSPVRVGRHRVPREAVAAPSLGMSEGLVGAAWGGGRCGAHGWGGDGWGSIPKKSMNPAQRRHLAQKKIP